MTTSDDGKGKQDDFFFEKVLVSTLRSHDNG